MATARLKDCNRNFKKKIIAGSIALATAVFPSMSNGYSPGKVDSKGVVQSMADCGSVIEKGTHPLLARKSVELLVKMYPQYSFTPSEKEKIEQGTIDEDSPEFCYIRSYNHFTELGTKKGIMGFPSSLEWVLTSLLQSGSPHLDNFSGVMKMFYSSLLNKGTYPYGDHSWTTAVKNKSMLSLGHILHLIQDLTVPAHARNDAHPGLWNVKYIEEFNLHSFLKGDSYEIWAEDINKFSLLEPKQIPQYNSIDEIFNDLVNFTGANFFSDDTIGMYNDPAVDSLIEKKEGWRTYYYNKIGNAEVPIARKSLLVALLDKTKVSHKPHFLLDDTVLEAQWRVLGTKAVEMGAAALLLYLKQTSGPGCSSHAAQVCSGNVVYWKDSCGKLEDKVQSCGTNQTCESGKCVDTNQELFVDLGDGTVKNVQTSDIWQKTSQKNKFSYVNAKNYCLTLSLGGSTNWRLPVLDELLTLYTKNTGGNYIYSIFKGPYDCYWTDSCNLIKINCDLQFKDKVCFGNNIEIIIEKYKQTGEWGHSGEPDEAFFSGKLYVRCIKD